MRESSIWAESGSSRPNSVRKTFEWIATWEIKSPTKNLRPGSAGPNGSAADFVSKPEQMTRPAVQNLTLPA